MNWTDDAIVTSIIEGRDDGLVHLYRTYRSEFSQWAITRYRVDTDLAYDAFQEAVIALRFNVINGKMQLQKSALKTYLFSIGKHQLFNRLKKTKYEQGEADMMKYDQQVKSAGMELTARQILVRDQMMRMGEPCASILRMFYYLGYSMQVIAARMDYKNENVAKTQKMRCLKKLKVAIT